MKKVCVTWSHYRNFHSIYINNSPNWEQLKSPSMDEWLNTHGIPILWNTIEQYRGTTIGIYNLVDRKMLPPQKNCTLLWSLEPMNMLYYIAKGLCRYKVTDLKIGRVFWITWVGSHLITWTLQKNFLWLEEVICQNYAKIPSVRGIHLLLLGERQQMESTWRMQAGSHKDSPRRQPAWKSGTSVLQVPETEFDQQLAQTWNHFIPRALQKGAQPWFMLLSDSKQSVQLSCSGLLTFSSVR